jgi:hypothetical protein
MSYSLLLNISLGSVVVVGFLARYLAVLTHRMSARDGRLGFIVFLGAIVYAGFILASMDKVTYGVMSKTALIVALACAVLDATLLKLSKYI